MDSCCDKISNQWSNKIETSEEIADVIHVICTICGKEWIE